MTKFCIFEVVAKFCIFEIFVATSKTIISPLRQKLTFGIQKLKVRIQNLKFRIQKLEFCIQKQKFRIQNVKFRIEKQNFCNEPGSNEVDGCSIKTVYDTIRKNCDEPYSKNQTKVRKAPYFYFLSAEFHFLDTIFPCA